MPSAINSTDAFTATFTFSEEVTEFVKGDVTLTGGSKGTFSGSGKSYALAVTPAGSTDVVVTVTANSATDGANTGPATAATATAAWDATAPTVTDQRDAFGDQLDGPRSRRRSPSPRR